MSEDSIVRINCCGHCAQPYDGSEDDMQYDSDSDSQTLEDIGIDPNADPVEDIRSQVGEGQPEVLPEENNDSPQPDPQMLWQLVEDNGEVRHEKFQRTERRAQFKVEHNFNDIKDLKAYEDSIDNAYENAIKPMLRQSNPDDLYSAYIDHPELNPSIFIGYHKVSSFDKKKFLNKLYKIAQSNTSFFLDGVLKVRVAIIKTVQGAGRNKQKITTYETKAQKFKINNKYSQ